MNSQTHSSMLLSQSQLVQWCSAPAISLHAVLLEVDKLCQEVSIEHGKDLVCSERELGKLQQPEGSCV